MSNTILKNLLNDKGGNISPPVTLQQPMLPRQKEEDKSVEKELIFSIRKDVTENFKQRLIVEKDDVHFQSNVRQFIQDIVEQNPFYSTNVLKAKPLVDKIFNDIIGFGPLQILLDDKSITEIMVVSYDKVFVERKGIMTLVPEVKFDSNEHLSNTIQKIVQPMGKKIDDSEPLCDTSLPDGSRVNATFPPASPDGPTLTIRKFSSKKLTVTDYLKYGSLNEDMAKFIKFAVEGKANIIVAGGTGTGKTTLLNMISQFISDKDSIVTIEDTLELQLQQTNVRRLLARQGVNGKGEITIRRHVKNTLRMRPDRICVGEIRSGEIYDMLDSMSSGHEGGMGTIHTKGPRHLVDTRIPMLMAMSDIKMNDVAQQRMIADSIDLIIYIKRFKDGTRKITNITEIIGYGEEGAMALGQKKSINKIYLNDIFTFEEEKKYVNGKVQGKYITTGHIPERIINKAALYDATIDEALFKKTDSLEKRNHKESCEIKPNPIPNKEKAIVKSPFNSTYKLNS